MVAGEQSVEQSVARVQQNVSQKLGGVERSLQVLGAMLDGLELAIRPVKRRWWARRRRV